MCFDYFLCIDFKKEPLASPVGRAVLLIIGVFLINRERLRLQNYRRDTRSFEVKSNQLIFKRNKAPYTSYKLEEIKILLGHNVSSFEKTVGIKPLTCHRALVKKGLYTLHKLTNIYSLKIMVIQVYKSL